MKIAVIDVGSNSVRLAMIADGKTLYKRLSTTRLGEGLALSGEILNVPAERTARAIKKFVSDAERDGAQKVYVFATAAVRSASNRESFLSYVKKLCGVEIDVLSGAREAECGILGALGGKDGGIIDVGGASTEVTIRSKGQTVYSKSVNLGTVRLHDAAGRNKEKLLNCISEKIGEYGNFNASGFGICAVGGTATRLAAIKKGIKEYRPEIIDGTVLTVKETEELSDKLLTMSVEKIRAETICNNSADVVGGGALLLCGIMKKFAVKFVTVSESDNLEGYALLKEGGK